MKDVREGRNWCPYWGGKVSGFFASPVVNSNVGKKFFEFLPGEIVLASLDGFSIYLLQSLFFFYCSLSRIRYNDFIRLVFARLASTVGFILG
uniref:Uncharacterized protein n=1 Tax=Nelumbo nucifera TaxID=4432 RepID=A0A822ZDY0_NELNU|nr:TPA_asm: hypothetical protein HUJ06_015968 [Nelumbo nucifera]